MLTGLTTGPASDPARSCRWRGRRDCRPVAADARPLAVQGTTASTFPKPSTPET
jgi:hypothetical protein